MSIQHSPNLRDIREIIRREIANSIQIELAKTNLIVKQVGVVASTSQSAATIHSLSPTSAHTAEHFDPSADNTYDLGTSSNKWRNLYLAGTTTLNGITYTWPASDAAAFLKSDGAGNMSWDTGALTDEKVAVDAAATAGYIGAASSDGVLRTSSPLTYTDGGDYVTLGVDQSALDHGSIGGIGDDDHTQYLLAAGTRALTANWDAGSYQIRAQTFQSDVVTGTAPLTVASTTVVTNLNADLLDGNHASAFAASGHNHDHGTLTGLTDDDHSQYALLAGRATGQTLKGGTALGEDLTLMSTAHATKGSVIIGSGASGGFNYDETQDYLGLGITTSPATRLHVGGAPRFDMQSDTDQMNFNRYSATGRVQFAFRDESSVTIWKWGLTGSGSTDLNFYDGTQNALTLEQNGDILLNPGGNVGIGTANPTHIFEIDGGTDSTTYAYITGDSANAVQLSFDNTDTGARKWTLVSWGSAAGGGNLTGKFSIYDDTALQHRIVVDTAGNIGVGTASPGGSTTTGAGVLSIANGTAPVGGVANQCSLYAADVSSSSELFAFDEAGNATQLSPHDPETGEWIFYSHNTRTGKTVRVPMERLVRLVEELTGEKLMEVTYDA